MGAKILSKNNKKKSVLPGAILLPRDSRPSRMAKINAANPDMSDKDAAAIAGYSPNSSPTTLKTSKGYRLARQTIQEQRELLSLKKGFRFADVAGRMQKIFFDQITHDHKEDGKKVKDRVPVPPSVQVSAGKELKEIMGHEAPIKVEMEQRGLFMSFTELSGKDLANMRNHYAGSRQESPEHVQ